jgi:predicted small secreted protein
VKIMRIPTLRRACTLIALLGLAAATAACSNTFNGIAQDWNNDTRAIQQAFSNQ